jgi:phytoene dehydrogenase-like protein
MASTTRDIPTSPERVWAVRHDAGGEIAGKWDVDDEEAIIDRIERRIEQFAPGFRASIQGRHIFTPPKFRGP